MEGLTKRVLLLEDDLGLRTSLRLVLEDDGYDVAEAADAESALSVVEDTQVDIMLVDLMLGGVDGFTFIRRARPLSQAPIVVVSARDGVEDIVSALEAGADDYVTKPFDVAEVQARLRAMLRRPALASGAATGDTAEIGAAAEVVVLDAVEGPLVFDRAAAHLRRGDRDIHLTMTEYKLLTVLSDNVGRVLTRTALLDHVWDRGFFGDERIVDVHVRRLRKKLEIDPSEPRSLVTVRGLGYRLDAR
jgi:DNA-binding response OmpR family regulator